MVSLWQLFCQMLAYAINYRLEFMQCGGSGWIWVYTSILGSVMTLFHMMTIMMQAVLLLKVFHWVPMKMGYYDTLSVSPLAN
jgi:hypothetical protein